LPSSTRRPYRLAHPGSISSARLECSKTTLYSLASTTEHLVLVVRRPFFRDAAAEIEQAVQAEPDPRQRIRVYLAGGGTAMRRHAHAFYDDMVGYEPTAQIYRKNSAAAAHRVHQLIEEGVQACVFRALNGHFAAQVVAVTIDAVQSGGLLESTGLTAGTPSPSSATSCWTGSVRGKAHPGLLPQLSARPGIRSRRPGKARRKGCISRIVSARDHPVSWWMVCVHSRNQQWATEGGPGGCAGSYTYVDGAPPLGSSARNLPPTTCAAGYPSSCSAPRVPDRSSRSHGDPLVCDPRSAYLGQRIAGRKPLSPCPSARSPRGCRVADHVRSVTVVICPPGMATAPERAELVIRGRRRSGRWSPRGNGWSPPPLQSAAGLHLICPM
jgi:AcrR family transcriptional regulator